MIDVHEEADIRELGIMVGAQGIKHPVRIIQCDGDHCDSLASVDVQVYLDSNVRGIHMSRISEWLEAYRPLPLHPWRDARDALKDLRRRLGSVGAELTARFAYDKAQYCKAVVRMTSGECTTQDSTYLTSLDVPVFTVCPCSLLMCDGQAAHAQRCYVKATLVQYWEHLWERENPLDVLFQVLSKCGSAEVRPILKRPDERRLVIEGFANPKFVEDVVRDTVIAIRSALSFHRLTVDAWSQESIHPHNVVATAEVLGDEVQAQD